MIGVWKSTWATWRRYNELTLAEAPKKFLMLLSMAAGTWILFGLGWATALVVVFYSFYVADIVSYRREGKLNYVMGLLAQRHKDRSVFPIRVDYSDPALSFQTMMSGAWSPRYTYQPATEGKREIDIHLLAFEGVTTSEEALKRIAEAGFRPADSRELIVFRRRHRYANYDHQIAFLGAVYVPSDEKVAQANWFLGTSVHGLARVAYIPYRYFERKEPFFTTYYHYRKWFPGSVLWDSKYTRFAAVKIN